MLSPFRYMKEVIHLVFSNCRKTKCIKSNRRSDWSTGTRRRIFTRNRLYGQLVLRTSGRKFLIVSIR